jgi:hypothetical protein
MRLLRLFKKYRHNLKAQDRNLCGVLVLLLEVWLLLLLVRR